MTAGRLGSARDRGTQPQSRRHLLALRERVPWPSRSSARARRQTASADLSGGSRRVGAAAAVGLPPRVRPLNPSEGSRPLAREGSLSLSFVLHVLLCWFLTEVPPVFLIAAVKRIHVVLLINVWSNVTPRPRSKSLALVRFGFLEYVCGNFLFELCVHALVFWQCDLGGGTSILRRYK